MSPEVERFLNELKSSLKNDSFAKLTLANYKGTDEQLQRVLGRLITTSKGSHLSLVYRYQTRDITKNHEIDCAADAVGRLFEQGFRSGHLFTTTRDFQLEIKKDGKARLSTSKPTIKTATAREHDRKKKQEINPNAPYLHPLGITDANGRVLDRHRDKWRQINKYVEILGSLFDKSPLAGRTELNIVDMGAGKGYLTFAAYDYFNNVRKIQATVTGVESRSELVDLCNEIAARGGYERLKFRQSMIAETDVNGTDILIALHACNTATDDAIDKGITAEASLIITAPCCHQELRPQMKPPDVLRDVLKYGILLEREAESITDGLRAMLLEMSGYSTKIFEFVPVEHTPKNNMIVGTRDTRRVDIAALETRIQALMDFYGIERQRLNDLLRQRARHMPKS